MDRESIWSVPSGTQSLYFGLFMIQIMMAVLLLYIEGEALLDAWAKLGPIAIASAATAITVTEVGGTVMVLARGLAEHFEQRKRKLRLKIETNERELVFKLMETHPNVPLPELRRLIEKERGAA